MPIRNTLRHQTRRITQANLVRAEFGSWWILQRALRKAALKSGWYSWQQQARNWDDIELKTILSPSVPQDPLCYLTYRRKRGAGLFFDRVPDLSSSTSLDDRVEEIRRGLFPYFAHLSYQVGFPPNWHINPKTGQELSAAQHWSRIDDFGSGDIKLIWESSRFAWVYILCRAYARNPDDKYAQVFWELFESWCNNNQPGQGANWKCGQEAAIRMMAVCFGFATFLHSPATTPSRMVMVTKLAFATAKRISETIGYALSQCNNHGVSEAMALYSIGILFPELKLAERWKQRGKEILERLADELIYEDGAFSQHSSNYHRVMLHGYLWVLRLSQIHHDAFSQRLLDKFDRATQFLFQLQSTETGIMPNYGANDGALLLPLSDCDFRDFRPLLQCCHFLIHHTRLYDKGPWDEELVWIFGESALNAERVDKIQHNLQADQGGCYTIHAKDSMAFMRCARYQHRPAQCDQLHVDISWKNQAIALDAGTYSYNADTPFDHAFSRARDHNLVTVDKMDQMARPGKFLLVPWTKGALTQTTKQIAPSVHYWEASHNAYERLKNPPQIRRGVLAIDGTWVIMDRLIASAARSYELHWHLADFPLQQNEEASYQLLTDAGPYFVKFECWDTPIHAAHTRASTNSADGWWSPYYHARQPINQFDISTDGQQVLFLSIFSPSAFQTEKLDDDRFIVRQSTQEFELTLERHDSSQAVLKQAQAIQ